MVYIEVTVTMTPYTEDIADAIISEFGSIGYNGFYNTESGFVAYIPQPEFNLDTIEELPYYSMLKESLNITITTQEIPDQDWNAIWESNFSPIVIDDQIQVRAGFHEKQPNVKYDIIIDPKMSFGTGHHSTTALILRTLLEKQEEIKDKRVLDMGCGTGILAIMASMLGAKEAIGIDIDEWAYNNAIENLKTNVINNVNIFIGDAGILPNHGTFDLVLANINRNILLEDLKHYVNVMNDGSFIIMSGFYNSDFPKIREAAEGLGLIFDKIKEDNEWVAVSFYKK